MTKDEALKLALKFVEDSEGGTADLEAHIKAALAQPAQEPVLWMMPDGKTVNKWGLQFYSNVVGTPLYTSPPPQHKPLTLGQKQRLWSSVGDKPTLKDRVNAYGLAIEAAHGIGGEA